MVYYVINDYWYVGVVYYWIVVEEEEGFDWIRVFFGYGVEGGGWIGYVIVCYLVWVFIFLYLFYWFVECCLVMIGECGVCLVVELF